MKMMSTKPTKPAWRRYVKLGEKRCPVLCPQQQSVPTDQYVFIQATDISPARFFVYHLQNLRQVRERWCISVTPHLQWRAALYTGEAKGTNNHSEVSSNLHTWAGSPVNEFLCATTCLIINLFLPKTEKHSWLPCQPSYYSIKEERRRTGNGNSYLWLLLPSTDVFPLGILALRGALSPWFLGFLGGNSPAAVNGMAGVSPGCFLRPAGRI